MRDKICKAKRVDNGEWIYGYYIRATHHWHSQGIHEDWIVTDTIQNGGWCNVRQKYAVIPETISDFSGLTDANGIKIFEGDIHCNENNNKKFVVKFGHFYDEELLDDMYGWYMEDNWGNRFGLNGGECEYANIIGNIYDNPELLNN